jgi:hypothetical protein
MFFVTSLCFKNQLFSQCVLYLGLNCFFPFYSTVMLYGYTKKLLTLPALMCQIFVEISFAKFTRLSLCRCMRDERGTVYSSRL